MIDGGLAARRAILLVFFASVALYALWPWLPWVREPRTRTIVLYGFSVLGEVMNDAVIPAFEEEWRRQGGVPLEVVSSFSGSGTVTNQILLGVPADLAILSLELDASRLVAGGVLSGRSWETLPHRGVVNRTPFVILVRPGNPRGIRDFADLAKDGIRIVHPDPLTSGGAQWAILAEYGAAYLEQGADAAYRQLLGIWRNVVAQSPSARGARTQFEQGFGDALVTYEQEAVWDLARGKLRAEVVYPRRTILSEHTVVVVERNTDPDLRDAVRSFAGYLWSPEAQRAFVKHGFRSFDEELNATNRGLGSIEAPFTVAELGGWPAAKKDIVDAVWRDRVMKELRR